MGNLSSKLRFIVSIYLRFAAIHFLYKAIRLVYKILKLRRIWERVPGYPLDLLASEARRNVHRIHDWRTERLLQHPGAPLVKFNGINIVCATPEAVEFMLKQEFDSITKPSSKEDLIFLLLSEFIGGKGIFNLRHGKSKGLEDENKLWYQQRKTASLIFTKNKFQSLMLDTFSANADILVESLKETASRGDKIDIQKKFFSFTMDSIQNIFFGRKVNTMTTKNEDDRFANAFDGAHRSMLLFVIEHMPKFILSRFLLPAPIGEIYNDINTSLLMWHARLTSPHMKEFKQNIKILNDMAYRIIDNARNDPNLNKRRDMLALFLQSKADYSSKELRDIILNMTIAGRDTTACILTWTVYMLTQNPDIEQKLCKEIDEKLGDKKPSFSDISPENMPYLNGVLYEALRLHPPVPMDVKIVQKDVTYYDGTLLPKGTRLVFSPYYMGRNPSMYSNPHKCDPTRWIPFKVPDLYEFPVFQAGPRFCLGKDMAQFEARFLLARLYRHFRFKLLDGEAEKITYAHAVTMSLCNSKTQDSHNLWVIPIER